MKPSAKAYRLFHQGSLALAEIEHCGVRVDVPYLERAISETSAKVKQLKDELRSDPIYETWRKTFGAKTNLDSLSQLGHVIFKVLKYPCKIYTPKSYKDDGSLSDDPEPSAKESAFEGLDLPFAKKYIRYGHLKRAKNTFLEGIRRELVGEYIHPFYHLTGSGQDEKGGAKTYRGSCSDPNAQQFPGRDEEMGGIVRPCIIPRKGCRLIENDFGAHEFRIGACFWADPEMISYASDPEKDIHRDMASWIFRCPKRLVNKKTRYVAKNQFVFPTMYGSYYVKMAQHIWEEMEKGLVVGDVPVRDWLRKKGIDRLGDCNPKEEPREGTFERHMYGVERRFNEAFPVFARKKEEWYQEYRRNGGFPLLTGFWVSGIYSKNFVLNCPIQGPAFHCLLWSLIRVQKRLRRERMRARICMTIHDNIIGDVPDGETQDYLNIVKHVVEVELPKRWGWIVTPLSIESEVTPVDGNWWKKENWICDEKTWKPVKKN